MNLGYFAYRQYYPSLSDSLSHDAYKARVSPFQQDIPPSEIAEEGEEREGEALLDNYSEDAGDDPDERDGPVASGSQPPR